ncbi:MAG: hypothetical protein RLZ55_369 [Actinomycetota bacterium]|jgi:hypothetical protein
MALPKSVADAAGADDDFALPSEAKGEGLGIGDFEGHLVILRAAGSETETDTAFGLSTYIPAKILDVDGDLTPEGWEDIWVWSSGVRSQLKSAHKAGKPIVGVVGKGTAKPGKSAPWLLIEPTEAQRQAARDAYNAQAPF